MSEDAKPPPHPPDTLLVRYTPTPEEAEHYRRLTEQRHTGHRESWDGDWIMMYVVGALAVAAGFLCVALGIVNDPYNPAVPLLCGATYYAAEPIRNWLVARYYRRKRTTWQSNFLGNETEVELASAGVSQRTTYRKYAFDWPGVDQVTVSRDIIFLWIGDRYAILIPLRAVPEADKVRAVDIAKSRGAVLRQ